MVIDGAHGEPFPQPVEQYGRYRVILAKHRADDVVDRVLFGTEVHLGVDRQTVRGVENKARRPPPVLSSARRYRSCNPRIRVRFTETLRPGGVLVKQRCRLR